MLIFFSCLQMWIFARWKMLSLARSRVACFFYVLQRGRLLCTHLLFSLRLHQLLLSSVRTHRRRAVSAEAGTMSTPTNPEVKELNPVDFIQLQQYIECEYRQAAFAALNIPPHTHTSTHSHSFTVAHGFSYPSSSSLPRLLFIFSYFFLNNFHAV